jgi:hypothetical protein
VTAAPGTHAVDVAPGARYAVHTHSRLGRVPAVSLVELPSMRPVRALADNRAVAARLAALDLAPPQLVRCRCPTARSSTPTASCRRASTAPRRTRC